MKKEALKRKKAAYRQRKRARMQVEQHETITDNSGNVVSEQHENDTVVNPDNNTIQPDYNTLQLESNMPAENNTDDVVEQGVKLEE